MSLSKKPQKWLFGCISSGDYKSMYVESMNEQLANYTSNVLKKWKNLMESIKNLI